MADGGEHVRVSFHGLRFVTGKFSRSIFVTDANEKDVVELDDVASNNLSDCVNAVAKIFARPDLTVRQ